MHIALDCRSVHRHMGGIGRAALELSRALADGSHGHRITMIVASGHGCDLPMKNIDVETVDAAMIDERFDQLHLPALLEALAPDLYLNTTFSLPAIKTTRFQVSIIHDVVFEDNPEFVEPRLKMFLSRWSRFAAANADHIITDSDHARKRIQCVYGIEASRLTRIHLGISATCFAAPDEGEIKRVLAKYELRRSFILYLGSIEIKKGIPELIRAYARARKGGMLETLVLVGSGGDSAFDLDALTRSEGCQGVVRSLGYIDEYDKKALLKACKLFVFPSLYEGFGFPPLEAMALGTPCVVSDQTSLPEIVGNAALVTNIREPDEFAAALTKANQDLEFRREAYQNGPARAREFTWERSAAEVLAVCEGLEGPR